MVKLKKGYIQVYTGNGKGKTTAAIGLAVRAAGSGLKVYIAQFMKGSKYSEIKALEKLKSNITVKQYGRSGHFIKKGPEPDEKDRELAQECLKEVKGIIASGIYDVVILDEVCVAEYFKLCSVENIIDLINIKPENVELILTGRKTDGRIIEKADLVTEMREIKHYYNKGVPARKGIEK
jgi:cob(I)alamin adenosyltransferase